MNSDQKGYNAIASARNAGGQSSGRSGNLCRLSHSSGRQEECNNGSRPFQETEVVFSLLDRLGIKTLGTATESGEDPSSMLGWDPALWFGTSTNGVIAVAIIDRSLTYIALHIAYCVLHIAYCIGPCAHITLRLFGSLNRSPKNDPNAGKLARSMIPFPNSMQRYRYTRNTPSGIFSF